MTNRYWMAFALVGALGCGDSDANPKGPPAFVGNSAPAVEQVSLTPASPLLGRTIQVASRSSDPDGDALTARYVWRTPTGRVLGEGREFNTTGLRAGDSVDVVVVVSDGQVESEPFVKRFSLAKASIEVGLVVIDASGGSSPGSILQAVVESTDERAGGYEIEREWKVAGEIVGRDERLDTTSLAPGDSVTLCARLAFLDQRVTRSVTSRPLVLTRGGAPEIVSQPLAGLEGGAFSYQVRANSMAVGARLSYELLEGPEGMKVEPATGLVSWRPKEDQRGEFKVEVAARDQWGSGTAQWFKMRVDGSESMPASARE